MMSGRSGAAMNGLYGSVAPLKARIAGCIRKCTTTRMTMPIESQYPHMRLLARTFLSASQKVCSTEQPHEQSRRRPRRTSGLARSPWAIFAASFGAGLVVFFAAIRGSHSSKTTCLTQVFFESGE